MHPPKPDDIEYAMENTHVLREPDRRIDTFGSTRFRYIIISEVMDSVGRIKVRKGEVNAHKPQIIRPASYNTVELEVTTIPEPSSTALLGLGGLALILRRRK